MKKTSQMGLGKLALAVAVAGMAQMTFAAQLLEFKPVPVSDAVPEVKWVGAFDDALGSTGNADGNLPPNLQTPGGLRIETPLTIGGAIAGKSIGITGSTTFYDVTLIYNGLGAVGGPLVLGGTAIQGIGPGDFAFIGTGGDVLLTGNIASATLVATVGSHAAGVQSGTITYTGGAIYNALLAAGGSPVGNMSVSMTTGTAIAAVAGQAVLPFEADATGLFDTPRIPEPTSLGLLALGAMALVSRRRA